MERFFYVRPQPDLLPREKEQPQAGSGFADDCAAKPGAGFAERRRMIFLPIQICQ
jgi:hypothetical protein